MCSLNVAVQSIYCWCQFVAMLTRQPREIVQVLGLNVTDNVLFIDGVMKTSGTCTLVPVTDGLLGQEAFNYWLPI